MTEVDAQLLDNMDSSAFAQESGLNPTRLPPTPTTA